MFSAMLDRWLREPVDEAEVCLSILGGRVSWDTLLKLKEGCDLIGSGVGFVILGRWFDLNRAC